MVNKMCRPYRNGAQLMVKRLSIMELIERKYIKSTRLPVIVISEPAKIEEIKFNVELNI